MDENKKRLDEQRKTNTKKERKIETFLHWIHLEEREKKKSVKCFLCLIKSHRKLQFKIHWRRNEER